MDKRVQTHGEEEGQLKEEWKSPMIEGEYVAMTEAGLAMNSDGGGLGTGS